MCSLSLSNLFICQVAFCVSGKKFTFKLNLLSFEFIEICKILWEKSSHNFRRGFYHVTLNAYFIKVIVQIFTDLRSKAFGTDNARKSYTATPAPIFYLQGQSQLLLPVQSELQVQQGSDGSLDKTKRNPEFLLKSKKMYSRLLSTSLLACFSFPQFLG